MWSVEAAAEAWQDGRGLSVVEVRKVGRVERVVVVGVEVLRMEMAAWEMIARS